MSAVGSLAVKRDVNHRSNSPLSPDLSPPLSPAAFTACDKPSKPSRWSRLSTSLKGGCSLLLEKINGVYHKVLTLCLAAAKAAKSYIQPFIGWLGAKDHSIIGLLWNRVFFLPSIMGSATISQTHYERSPRRLLNFDERRALLPYVCLAAAVHSHSEKWLEKYEIKMSNLEDHLAKDSLQSAFLDGFELVKGSLLDWKSGTKIQLFESKNEYFLLFGDGAATTQLHTWMSKPDCKVGDSAAMTIFALALKEGVGALSPPFLAASRVTKLIQSTLKDKPITLVGQCWGGLLASFCGLDAGLHSVGINSVGMGSGLQNYLGDKLLKAGELSTHVFTQGDWTQDMTAVNAIDRTLSLLGIKTPGNFGRKFIIPSAYNSSYERHVFFLGSMMQSLGFDKRDVPHDLSDAAFKKIAPPVNLRITELM